MDSLQGHFLVASPHLPDPNFYRSVVLMIHHDETGAFGVILNRPSARNLGDIWDEDEIDFFNSELNVHLGGPVAGLVAVHTDPAFAEAQFMDGVYIASDKTVIDGLVQNSTRDLRIFSGYAGWGEGQLEGELEVGGWLHGPANLDDIFTDEDDLWKRVVQSIADEILPPSLRKQQLVSDPLLN